MKTVLYIHGKGGNATESTHYEKLFPDCKVIGLDYRVSRKTLSLFRDTRRSAFAERDFKGENFNKLKFFEVPCKTFSPWETGKEIHEVVASLKTEAESIILIANSIGAFFSMNANLNGLIEKAYFISPVVNMEKLICDMMKWAKAWAAPFFPV